MRTIRYLVPADKANDMGGWELAEQFSCWPFHDIRHVRTISAMIS